MISVHNTFFVFFRFISFRFAHANHDVVPKDGVCFDVTSNVSILKQTTNEGKPLHCFLSTEINCRNFLSSPFCTVPFCYFWGQCVAHGIPEDNLKASGARSAHIPSDHATKNDPPRHAEQHPWIHATKGSDVSTNVVTHSENASLKKLLFSFNRMIVPVLNKVPMAGG